MVLSVVLVTVMLAMTCQLLPSQTIAVGIGVGYKQGESTLDLRGTDQWFNRDTYRGTNASWSGFVEMVLRTDISWSLASRLSTSHSRIQLSDHYREPEVMIPGPADFLSPSEMRAVFDRTMVCFELTGRWHPWEELWMMAGPVVGYQSFSRFKQAAHYDTSGVLWIWDEQFTVPGPVPVEVGTLLLVDDGSTRVQHHLALGLLFGAGYDLPLSGTISLAPEVRLHFDLASPIEGASWNWLAAGAGLALRFNL